MVVEGNPIKNLLEILKVGGESLQKALRNNQKNLFNTIQPPTKKGKESKIDKKVILFLSFSLQN